MQKYKKYQSLLLSVAKKMKKAFAGAGEAVGPVRRTSRGRMSEREGGVCGERIRSRSGCALRNIFCFCLREGYLCPRCSCHCQAVRSVSSSGRSKKRSARPGNGNCTSGRDNLPSDRNRRYCGERIRNGSGCALRILLPPAPTSGPGWSFAPDRPPPLRLQRLFSSFSQQKGEAIDIFCIFASIGKIMNLKCRNCMKRR